MHLINNPKLEKQIKLIGYDIGDFYGNNQQEISDISDHFIIANHTQSIELEGGWNMIGVPIDLYDTNSEMLFPSSEGWVLFDPVGLFNDIQIKDRYQERKTRYYL